MVEDTLALDPLIGKIISERYRVLERIGRGGFGAVYKVQHVRLDKTLALKVLFEHTHQNPRMIKRFEREARATCRIGHDNIVEITDFARDRRVGYYFVMEYLAGETLCERLRKLGPMPVARIIHVGCQIADALAATHSKGIVHRDLKPDNIFLMRKRHEEDFVKVLDFGIAAMGASDEQAPRLTRHGAMLGTPAYMSPEQAEGKPADNRSDIYSLGIILYEMATGKVPYRNAASMAVLEMHRSTEPIPPRKARPDLDIPSAMEAIILRALRKSVSQRYQSMREVYNDLVNISHQIDMSGVQARRPEVRVDAPTAPLQSAEPEEPEWLDEDLVLLDDEDLIEEEPTQAMPVVSSGIILDDDPTRVDSFPGHYAAPAAPTGPMLVRDADILDSSPAIPEANASPGVTEETVAATVALPSEVRQDDSHSEPKWTSEPVPVRPEPARTSPSTRAQSGRRKPSVWQRPPVLIAVGFLLTVGLWLLGHAAWQAFSTPEKERPERASRGDREDIDERETDDGLGPFEFGKGTKKSAPGKATPHPVQRKKPTPEVKRTAAKTPEAKAPTAAEVPTAAGAPERVAQKPAAAPQPASLPQVLTVKRQGEESEQPRGRAGVELVATPVVTRRAGVMTPATIGRAGIALEQSQVFITLLSTPEGATVSRGGKELGKTPLDLTLDRADERVGFKLTLKGHVTSTTRLKLNASVTKRVKLRKKGRGGGNRRGGGGRGGNSYDFL